MTEAVQQLHSGGVWPYTAHYNSERKDVRVFGGGYQAGAGALRVCIGAKTMTQREAAAFELGLKILGFLEAGKIPGNALKPYESRPQPKDGARASAISALDRLMTMIESHWDCADGPPRAWFEYADAAGVQTTHRYSCFGFLADSDGHGVEERLAQALLFTLASVNKGGLLVWRRRPVIESFDCDGARKTEITCRVAFIGGKHADAPPYGFVEDGCVIPPLKD